MKIDIVLIHTGTIFPDYINDCITQLKKYKFNIHLILSECLINYLKHDDIILVKAEDYFDGDYNTYDIKNHDISFRDGFWKRTSSRFILLNSYSKRNNLKSFFHIENDILIFSDLKETKNLLDNSKYQIGLVIDSENRCIPSIIYFKSHDISDKISKFIFKNNSNNDMSNLFNFFKANRDTAINLPILSNNQSIKNKISGDIDFCNLYNELQGIFDGAAIGQYIGGIDTRSDQKDTSGFINETTIFNVSDFKYIWENSEPYMIDKYNNKVKIHNLHIHSKDLKKIMNK